MWKILWIVFNKIYTRQQLLKRSYYKLNLTILINKLQKIKKEEWGMGGVNHKFGLVVVLDGLV